MKGNSLRNRFFKNCSEFNKISGSKQQNLSVSFLRKTETDYNLNKKDVTDLYQIFFLSIHRIFQPMYLSGTI